MKRKLLCAALPIGGALHPAAAWDADPASFRANPEAWVRATLLPKCKAPKGAEEIALCKCIVPDLAKRISEDDVAHVNDPGFDKAIVAKTGMLASLLACYRLSH
jgi:hypothetical protein